MTDELYPHGRALDNLGAHLLGRKPMPKDERDYKLEEYLDAHERAFREGDSLRTDMTVQQLVDGGWLTSWHGILAFWKWLKTVLNGPQPSPQPTPTPPSPTPPQPAPVDLDVVWQIGPISDQGQTPHCVGFTGLDWGNCQPINDEWPNIEGHTIYYACKVVDGEPKAEDGSDSRSLCKVLKNMSRLGVYAFTTDVAVIRDYVRSHGPVGIGIPWDNDMFKPTADNYVHPGGGEAGGHELEVVGHLPHGHGSVKEPTFVMPNHWGDQWGDHGVAYITETDLQELLNRSGEAWAGLELPL